MKSPAASVVAPGRGRAAHVCVAVATTEATGHSFTWELASRVTSRRRKARTSVRARRTVEDRQVLLPRYRLDQSVFGRVRRVVPGRRVPTEAPRRRLSHTL